MSETPCPFCGQIHGDDMSECADGFTSRHNDEGIGLTANIERLEADLSTVKDAYDDKHRAYALLREAYQQLLAERDALLDALRWCGGSADFGHGGQAREGWQRKVAPLFAERVRNAPLLAERVIRR